MKLGMANHYAHKWAYIKIYWNVVGDLALTCAIINERLDRFYIVTVAMYSTVCTCPGAIRLFLSNFADRTGHIFLTICQLLENMERI